MPNTAIKSVTEIVNFIETFNPPKETIGYLVQEVSWDNIEYEELDYNQWIKCIRFATKYLDQEGLIKVFSIFENIKSMPAPRQFRSDPFMSIVVNCCKDILEQELTDEEQISMFPFFEKAYMYLSLANTVQLNEKNTYFKNICKLVDISI